MLQTIALEKSTNTHTATKIQSAEELNDGVVSLKATKDESLVLHGEHGPMVLESENVVKYVQQELNPMTKKFRQAYD